MAVSDVMAAAALASCIGSGLVVAVLLLTLDGEARQRHGWGLALLAGGLLLFSARVALGMVLADAAVLALLAVVAAALFLLGLDRLLLTREAAV